MWISNAATALMLLPIASAVMEKSTNRQLRQCLLLGVAYAASLDRTREALTCAAQALGDKLGIKRYGFFLLPMDESLARVAVDIGGRPHLVYQVEAPTQFVRDFNIILVKEFARAFSNALGCNLHIMLEYGEEPHHVAEAIFKGLSRALDAATQIDLRTAGQLPSTKGKI